MTRLSLDILRNSPTYLNPSGLYTLDLRSNHLSSLEGLASTLDSFECIDLSDNRIVDFGGLPQLNKLKELIICRNNISDASQLMAELRKFPNLELLNLSFNKISTLPEGFSAPKLKQIILFGNPVDNLAPFSYNLPSLEYIDFAKARTSGPARVTGSQLDKVALKEQIKNISSLSDLANVDNILASMK
jgi:Leucine-rich repeat (LRR) protein